MTTVPEIGALLVLVPLKDKMFPLPDTPRLIALLLFVQLNTVPVTAPLKLIAAVDAALHTTWSDGFNTLGIGLTVMVNA